MSLSSTISSSVGMSSLVASSAIGSLPVISSREISRTATSSAPNPSVTWHYYDPDSEPELQEIRYQDGIHLHGGDVYTARDDFQWDNLTLDDPDYNRSINFTMPGDEENWVWRVNITEVDSSVLLNLGQGRVDGYTPAITYDLQWPNSTADASEIVATHEDGRGRNLCASFYSVLFPPNVTNDWRDDGTANCESALGDDCLRAILDGMEPGISNNRGYCPYLPDIYRLDACSGHLGISHRESHLQRTIVLNSDGSLTFDFLANPDGPVTSGGLVALQYGNLTTEAWRNDAIRAARSRLNMLVVTGPNLESQALCMRMDPEIDDWEVSTRADEACLRNRTSGELVQCDRRRLPDSLHIGELDGRNSSSNRNTSTSRDQDNVDTEESGDGNGDDEDSGDNEESGGKSLASFRSLGTVLFTGLSAVMLVVL